jgi:hypothetical protein
MIFTEDWMRSVDFLLDLLTRWVDAEISTEKKKEMPFRLQLVVLKCFNIEMARKIYGGNSH